MGRYPAALRGEAQYQAAIRRLRAGEMVGLFPEPDNPHDPRAIRVESPRGETIGYVERESWITRAMLDERAAVVTSVKAINSGPRGTKGVVLDVWTGADADNPRRGGGWGGGEWAGPLKLAAAIIAAGGLLTLCTHTEGSPPGPTKDAAVAAIDDTRAAAQTESYCAGRYPLDMAMRAACGRNARAGLDSFREIAADHAGSPAMRRALAHCLDRYPGDYAMVGACARNSVGAGAALSE